MQRERKKTLYDVLQAIEEVTSFLEGKGKEEFHSNRFLQLAVEREFEIIGEALKRLSRMDEASFAKIQNVTKIVGLRNVIAHGYDVIDYDIIWDAAKKDVPRLETEIKGLLNEGRLEGEEQNLD